MLPTIPATSAVFELDATPDPIGDLQRIKQYVERALLPIYREDGQPNDASDLYCAGRALLEYSSGTRFAAGAANAMKEASMPADINVAQLYHELLQWFEIEGQ